jgi:hypothetical protein
VALIDGYIWFWVLENMRSRLEEEAVKQSDGFESRTVQVGNGQSAYQSPLQGGQDLNCTVCGKSLLPSRAVFRCQCGCISHAECWEKHVMTSHRPSFTLGYVTLDDEFKPKGGAASQVKEPAAKSLVAAQTR